MGFNGFRRPRRNAFSMSMPGASRWSRWCLHAAGSLAVVGLAVLLSGCTNLPVGSPFGTADKDGFFGWHIGAPFDTSEVKTVFVYFKTQSYRRDLQLMLTEATQKEISMRTPFTVVGRPDLADSLLRGVITMDAKNLVVEAPTNLPRELNATMTVYINWTHNPETEDEKKRLPTQVTEVNNFVPEVGETTLSAYTQLIQSIAKQIVDMMEQPWFNDEDLK
jgi:Lipopolysaccharide-assembly